MQKVNSPSAFPVGNIYFVVSFLPPIEADFFSFKSGPPLENMIVWKDVIGSHKIVFLVKVASISH